MSDEEILVTLSLRFPSLDRRALAEHLGPVITEALAAGGSLTSLMVGPYTAEDEDD